MFVCICVCMCVRVCISLILVIELLYGIDSDGNEECTMFDVFNYFFLIHCSIK